MTGTADGRQPQQQEYDEWGQPIPPAAPYREAPQQYGYQQQYGYDAYGQPVEQQQPQYYAEPGYDYQQQPQQPQYEQQPYQDSGQYYAIPEQQAPPVYEQPPPYQQPPAYVPPPRTEPAPAQAAPAPGPGEPGYGTEEFTFVDDAEESADVIDWMKFSETRGERRDERRKRLRNRLLAAVVALVLIAGGTVGYLWAKGSLFGSTGTAVAASTKRTVIAVHLHDLNKNIYTALLVSDPAAGTGATVLIPGALGVPTEGGGAPMPLGIPGTPGSADGQGNAATRDGLNTLLGANISATWGLYTPFLQKLVDIVAVGGITVDANTTVSVGGKVLVSPGKATLHGDAAIAYATYQAKGESPSAQLSRFGQVMAALVAAMPEDPSTAASDITQMGAVPDPSLSDSTLGAVLAALSKDAKAGKYSTSTLAVKGDGTLGPGAGDLVKRLLGGQVSDSGDTATVARVAVKDATGSANGANLAAADVVNGGFTLVPGTAKAGSSQAVSTVDYTDPARAGDAKQVAQDLGLPASAVRKVTTDQSVDVMVVLGKDFKG
ncbi:LCP family protein [Streptacidiphilus sp. PAMC 29251]